MTTNIGFHHSDGTMDVLHVEAGTSVMQAAVTNGIAGIVGECGGQAMCATCHIYVREEYVGILPPLSNDEDEMLDCTSEPRDERRSRLACQIAAGRDFDAIQVDVPVTQF